MKSLPLGICLILIATAALTDAARNEWSTQNRNRKNDRMVRNSIIDSDNVASLEQKWLTPTAGWPTSNPAIARDHVVVTDVGGWVRGLSKRSGAPLWEFNLESVTGYEGDCSYGTPAVYQNLVVVTATYSRYVIGVSLYSGRVYWKTQVGSFPDSVLPSSPTLMGDRIFVGTDCWNWSPEYVGEVFCLQALTGHVLWSVRTIDLHYSGFAGAPVSDAAFAVDHTRGLLYFGTGDPFLAPDHVVECVYEDWYDRSCFPTNVRIDSVVAVRISNGEIVWTTPLWPAHLYHTVCNTTDECYVDTFVTFAAPLISGGALVVSQHSGYTFRLDPNHGNVLWYALTGPGGWYGGCRQGGAADGEYYYIPEANSAHEAWYVESPEESWTQGGFWSVIDLQGGSLMSQRADPYTYEEPFATEAAAPPTVINDLIVFPSTAPEGPLHFVTHELDIVHTLHTGTSNYQGVAAVDSCVYVAAGADPWDNEYFTPEGFIIAYCLP